MLARVYKYMYKKQEIEAKITINHSDYIYYLFI